ncbi:MAG: hypothetical protein HQL74_04740 [Magnetococcales bacterium]|nr:hypothetical protein [Magnetococcales bacterium]
MKKTSKLSVLATLSLAGAIFVGSSLTAATPAKADAVVATWLAGAALGLTLWHDPWPVRAALAPLNLLTGTPVKIGYAPHSHGYYGMYDSYVHVGVPGYVNEAVVASGHQCPCKAAK